MYVGLDDLHFLHCLECIAPCGYTSEGQKRPWISQLIQPKVPIDRLVRSPADSVTYRQLRHKYTKDHLH